MFPSDACAEKDHGCKRAGELRSPVGKDAWPGEVACEREREGDGGVEVCARDVTDRVDHGHDHEAEGDRDADVSELVRLCVDHDCAGAGEDERKRPDRLGGEDAGEFHARRVRTAASDSGTTRK